MSRKEIAIELYRKVRKKQLDDMLARMPDNKRGVEITNNGITYLAFIRSSRQLSATGYRRFQGGMIGVPLPRRSTTRCSATDGRWTLSSTAGRYCQISVAPSGYGLCLMAWHVAELSSMS